MRAEETCRRLRRRYRPSLKLMKEVREPGLGRGGNQSVGGGPPRRRGTFPRRLIENTYIRTFCDVRNQDDSQNSFVGWPHQLLTQ
jgi:hypothetical protein